MTTAKGHRKPRYKRLYNEIPLSIQERDAEIIQHVFRHRFLTSEHIRALVAGSQQKILRRLQALFHGGFLDRPKEQLSWLINWKGGQPIVYGLGNKGADLLTEKFNIIRGKVDWTSKNREIKSHALKHTLGIADFMVSLETACKNEEFSSSISLINQEEVAKTIPKHLKNKNNPLSWNVEFKQNDKKYKFGVLPDKIFGLHFPKRKSDIQTAYYFLELDRATMPIKSSNPFRSSISKKMLSYYNSWQQELYSKIFPFKNPRILFVTESEERIQNMINLNKEIDPRGNGLRIFLFTTQKHFNLKEPEKLLNTIWTNGRGEQGKLFENDWII